MPALPDRRGRPCPTPPTSSSSVAATPGINAARELADAGHRGHPARGAHARLGRVDPERRHRPPRLQAGARRRSSSATAERPARRCTAETLESYALVKRLDRRRGHRLRLPRSSATSSSRTAPSHVDDLEAAAAEPRVGRRDRGRSIPRERIREEIGTDAYYGGARRRRQRRSSTRAGTSPASPRPPTGPAPTCTRASARPRSAGRPTAGSSSRPSAARSSPATSSSPRTATRTASRRRCAAGSSRSGATSSRASHCPRTWHASSPRTAARSSTRRTSCTTGTSRRTAG